MSVTSKINQISPPLSNVAVARSQYCNFKKGVSEKKKKKKKKKKEKKNKRKKKNRSNICQHSFYKHQRVKFFDLQDHSERFCNVLSVFGFNSAMYDFNLLKSYWPPLLVNERGIEPMVIKKANQFVSFKFGNV